MKKIILVTGGSGLVGNGINLIKINYNYNFIFASSKDCNLEQYANTLDYFNKLKPDYIIHLAAYVGGLFKNMNCKVEMLEKNILINTNVLKAAHNIKVKKLIACLSTCIFPDKITYPIDETMLHMGPPHFSNDAYAYAKRILEVQCKAYQEQYNDNFICIIPTNIYGPYDNFNLSDAHVIPSLIHKCYIAKKKSLPFIVSGTGTPLRQFIYSEDLGKLILWVLENYVLSDSIILSVNESDEISIGQIATIIAKKFDYSHNIKFDETKPDGQYKKTVSNKKLLKEIGNFEFVNIEDGLTKTIDWFIKNYENIRK